MMPADRHKLIRPGTFEYRPGQGESEHTHNEHQLVHVSYGLLDVEAGGSRWIVPPLRALWIPALLGHTLTARVDTEMSALYLSPTISLPGAGDVAVLSVSPLLRELIGHLRDRDPHGGERRRLEAVIVDQLAAAGPAAPLRLPKLRDPRLRAIGTALDVDPTDRRTLRQFGAMVGASERTLQRLFAAETGTTFGRWRTQLRLQHGVAALTNGHTVATAASLSGYREPSAFIAAFRSAFGTTPGAYLIGDESRSVPSPTFAR